MESVANLLFLGELSIAWESRAVHIALVREVRKKNCLGLPGTMIV